MTPETFVARSYSRRHVLFVPAALAAEPKPEPRLIVKTGIKAGSRYLLGYP